MIFPAQLIVIRNVYEQSYSMSSHNLAYIACEYVNHFAAHRCCPWYPPQPPPPQNFFKKLFHRWAPTAAWKKSRQYWTIHKMMGGFLGESFQENVSKFDVNSAMTTDYWVFFPLRLWDPSHGYSAAFMTCDQIGDGVFASSKKKQMVLFGTALLAKNIPFIPIDSHWQLMLSLNMWIGQTTTADPSLKFTHPKTMWKTSTASTQ